MQTKTTMLENLSRKVQLRFKQSEKLLGSLLDLAECEQEYSSRLDQIANSVQPEPEDIEDLIDAYKTSLRA